MSQNDILGFQEAGNVNERKIIKSTYILSFCYRSSLRFGNSRVFFRLVGSVITEIDEDFPDPTPTPMGDNPSYKKEIWTGNFSGNEKGFNADCYVRMSLSYSDDDIGRGVELLGVDKVNWVYNPGDGYYYYRNIVA